MQVVQGTLERSGIRESQGRSRAQDFAGCRSPDALAEVLCNRGQFPSMKDEVINHSLADAAARRTSPVDVDQVNLLQGKGKKGEGKDGKGNKGKGKGKGKNEKAKGQGDEWRCSHCEVKGHIKSTVSRRRSSSTDNVMLVTAVATAREN